MKDNNQNILEKEVVVLANTIVKAMKKDGSYKGIYTIVDCDPHLDIDWEKNEFISDPIEIYYMLGYDCNVKVPQKMLKCIYESVKKIEFKELRVVDGSYLYGIDVYKNKSEQKKDNKFLEIYVSPDTTGECSEFTIQGWLENERNDEGLRRLSKEKTIFFKTLIKELGYPDYRMNLITRYFTE